MQAEYGGHIRDRVRNNIVYMRVIDGRDILSRQHP